LRAFAQNIAAMQGFNRPAAKKQWLAAWHGDRLRPSRTLRAAERIIPTETISMYKASVGVFTPFLGNLSSLLDHAAGHAEARKINPSILLNARLYPNVYNFTRQVGEAVRHAVIGCALLAGVNPPVSADNEPDIPELKARIATAIDFMRGLRPAAINGTENKQVVFTFRNGATREFTGLSLLLTFSVPQFYFHVTTAYDILRHCGVELAKNDFLGPPVQFPED
jgi:hypothetical protein